MERRLATPDLNQGTLAFSLSSSLNYSHTISGSGGLTVAGNLLMLTGSNTYTGPTTIAAARSNLATGPPGLMVPSPAVASAITGLSSSISTARRLTLALSAVLARPPSAAARLSWPTAARCRMKRSPSARQPVLGSTQAFWETPSRSAA